MEAEPAVLIEMYRRMLAIRLFDTAAEKLVGSGEIVGSIHTSIGQEGVCVGAGMALRDDDYVTGNHRSHGHPIGKGAHLDALMAELFGKRTGVCKGMGGSMHLADFGVGSLGESAIIGSTMPVAVGAGLAARMQKRDAVCLAFFGDGAANAGAFHESLNMAAVWKLPVVFVCENNQYAVSTKHSDVCAVERIGDRAPAYGIPGSTVDGQDVLVVWRAVRDAVDRARRGDGPTLIEGLTYRYGDHSFLMSRLGSIRPDDEVDRWRRRDPVDILGRHLIANGVADADRLDAVREEVAKAVDGAVERARQAPEPVVDDMWSGMYVDAEGFKARRHHRRWLERSTTA